MHLQQQPGGQSGLRQGLGHPVIATLMMSAALPWIGALSAARLAASRTWRLLLSSSGR